MKEKIVSYLIGKNLPHLARVIVTGLGFLLLSLPLFDGKAVAIDPSLVEAIEATDAPSRAEVEDGLTLNEIVGALLGVMLIWTSRVISRIRAINPQVGTWLGGFIGRSWSSFGRAMLTGAGVLVARWIGSDAPPEVIVDTPLDSILGQGLALLVPILLGNVWSKKEDGKTNPVEKKLSR